jgi:hypothetical protein
MSGNETSALIDRLAAILSPHLGRNEDAADKVATEIVGDLQSRFVLISKAEVDAARADLAAMNIPGLFQSTATKGRT